MATKGPVLSIAELPAFVRSSPVHRSLQTTKDVATRLASLPPPEHYPRLRRFLSRRQELCQTWKGLEMKILLITELLINNKDDIMENQESWP